MSRDSINVSLPSGSDNWIGLEFHIQIKYFLGSHGFVPILWWLGLTVIKKINQDIDFHNFINH